MPSPVPSPVALLAVDAQLHASRAARAMLDDVTFR